MPGKTTRSSNLELLRILCMLLIIGDHLTGQSGIADYTTLPSSFAFCLIGCGSRIACSVLCADRRRGSCASSRIRPAARSRCGCRCGSIPCP